MAKSEFGKKVEAIRDVAEGMSAKLDELCTPSLIFDRENTKSRIVFCGKTIALVVFTPVNAFVYHDYDEVLKDLHLKCSVHYYHHPDFFENLAADIDQYFELYLFQGRINRDETYG